MDLFLRLSPDDRALLAEVVQDERKSGLHDFAAFLEWATSCDGMSIRWGGGDFGPSPFNSMHGDFVGRQHGDEWEN